MENVFELMRKEIAKYISFEKRHHAGTHSDSKIRAYEYTMNLVSDFEKKYSDKLVSIEAYKQVAKERSVAEEQLHELGYQLGEKIDHRIPWIPVEEKEAPDENGKYLVTACLYDNPQKTRTEIVSYFGEWNVGNNWNILAWCPQKIKGYKAKEKNISLER